MMEMSPSQKRRTVRRRQVAVTRAVEYLNAGLAVMPGTRKGSAERQVRESPQPMSTAKALVKGWRQRHHGLAVDPAPQDERVVLIQAACAMELGHAWPVGRGTEAA